MTTRTMVILDVETTGLDQKKDRILEVAGIALKIESRAAAAADGVPDAPEHAGPLVTVAAVFDAVVDPGPSVEIPPNITQLTGIDRDVIDQFGRQTEEVLVGFQQFLELAVGGFTGGHNVQFDLRFLGQEMMRVGNHSLTVFGMPFCTMALAGERRIVPRGQRISLRKLCQQLGTPEPGQEHSAFADAAAAAAVALRLVSVAQGAEMDWRGHREEWVGMAQKSDVVFSGARNSINDRLRILRHYLAGGPKQNPETAVEKSWENCLRWR